METAGQIVQWSTAWLRRIRQPLRDSLVLLLGAALLVAPASIASADGPPASAKKSGASVRSSTADTESCVKCHAATVTEFAGNPHAQPAGIHAGKAITCASCHLSAKEHIATGGSVSGMLNPGTANPKGADAVCLQCHAGKHAAFERSAHGKANVGCSNCHRIHGAGEKAHLLTAAEPGLCYECHAGVKPQFALPHHHKVDEGLLKCSDCHEPHATSTRLPYRSFVAQDETCTNCHTGMAGPFRYEHPAISSEGCTACHFAHGGPNPHLLVKADINTLCRQCHDPKVTAATSAHMQAAPGDHAKEQCTACHIDIHGSSSSPAFLEEAK